MAPLRGYTPHFASGVTLAQWSSARIENGEWSAELFESEKEFEIELRAGDVLYHPAGILHRVEVVGEEDAVSINISLDLNRPADYFADTIRALLRRNEITRRPLVNNPSPEELQQSLDHLKQTVASLTVDQVFPPALWPLDNIHPQNNDFFLHEPLSENVESISLPSIVVRNPLSQLLPLAHYSEGVSFSVVFNSGDQDLNPWLRTRIFPGKKHKKIMRLMTQLDRGNPMQLGALMPEAQRLIKLLLHRGYLTAAK